MCDKIIVELENAANILMAPPNVVSSQQRHDAEKIFLEFRKSKSSYGLCKDILDTSHNSYVLFESAEVLKTAVIRDWTFFQNDEKTVWILYLLKYCASQDVPAYVMEKLLQVLAIMVKRISGEDNGAMRSSLLKEVERLIKNGLLFKRIAGCHIIMNLLQEYATSVKSTDVGLPWEVHFAAKKQFETTDLQRIFQFCVYLLSDLVKDDPPFPLHLVQVTVNVLKISETILTWTYVSDTLPKRLIGMYESDYESDDAPPLKLTSDWCNLMLDSGLVPLMFQVFWKVREFDQLAHHCLSCLVQLASLSGPIVVSQERRLKYLDTYLMTFVKLLSNITMRSKEALAFSNIAKKITIFFIQDLPLLSGNCQKKTFDEFVKLTCHSCYGTILEGAQGKEENYYRDAFNNMLDAWLAIIHDGGESCNSIFAIYADKILAHYINCHLTPPHGCRQASKSDREEVEFDEDSDRIFFKEQLQAIGVLGRLMPARLLPILFNLLEEKISEFVNDLSIMQTRAMNLSESVLLDNLYEDINWLILISGHVLCMESDGETPMIPSSIMRHSMDQFNSGKTTPENTMRAIFAVQHNNYASEDLTRCDDVMRIVIAVMKLCAIEDHAASVKLSQFISPEIGSSLMWFLQRWCRSYLMPVESYYKDMSPVFINCLGKDTDGAKFLLDFVLSKIRSNICNYNSEEILLRDTVDLFCETMHLKYIPTYIVQSQAMRNLIHLFHHLDPGSLPPNIIRGLCKGFVRAGTALQDDGNSQFGYYELVLTPLQRRFNALLRQDNFTKICLEERTQVIIVDMLESFIGIAQGSVKSNAVALFNFLAPMLSDSPVLLTLYTNYQVIVQLILELFGQCAKHQLCYLSPLDSKRLYDTALATVQAYAECNTGRIVAEAFGDEFNHQDLDLVLKLLTYILSKDCFDLYADDMGHEEDKVKASDVSLFGLTFIMPLMSDDLLKFPSLCSAYYDFLVLLGDTYPEKISELPPELARTLLKTVELGLTRFGTDIVRACLDFLHGMASHILGHGSGNAAFSQALRPFLGLLVHLSVSHQINLDVVSTAGPSIYVLMCCFREDLNGIVEGLVGAQTDQMTASRLAAAFTQLMMDVDFSCDRLSKLRFGENFEKFVNKVYGFLMIK